MTLAEIHALKQLSPTELVRVALDRGLSIEQLSTPDLSGRRLLLTTDGLRIRIIDRICELELVDREGPTTELPQQ